jgi:Skp family chaperone for outer membrane proteins
MALVAWFVLSPAWTAWAAAAVIALIGFGLAERVFRRLATAEQIRADLEDRVRNPP